MATRKKRRKATGTAARSQRKGGKPRRLHDGEWFERLVALQQRLRAPNGCPWDREQTHATLRTYLIEEAYEVLDALENGDDVKFADELGDLLLQIVFHSEIAREQRRFTVSDVIRSVHDKMVRRHPHVFGDTRARNTAEVLKNWDKIKQEERRQSLPSGAASGDAPPASLLDGLPRGLPATLEGLQLTRKAARAGFDWEDSTGVLAKIREECAEISDALGADGGSRNVEEEIGDLLFAAVNLARFLKVDPEIALKHANTKFIRRFRQMEKLSEDGGARFENLTRPEKERLWETVKLAERARGKHSARVGS